MLTINFELDFVLQKALKLFCEVNAPTRALIVRIENEVMRLHGPPLEATASIEDDLVKLRTVIATAGVAAAYIILKLDEGKFAQVTFCSDHVKPKEKMVYASGAGHLADGFGLGRVVREHVACVDEITLSLFAEETAESRAGLMTEKEKLRTAMDTMELAPMPVMMPGVALPLSESGREMLKKLVCGGVSAVVFAVEADKITVDNTLDALSEASSSVLSLTNAVRDLLPKDHPRFVVLCSPKDGAATTPGKRKVLMVYMCPAACKPREKMTYASSKSSFLLQAGQHRVKFVRRLELDDVDELGDAVADAFADDGND